MIIFIPFYIYLFIYILNIIFFYEIFIIDINFLFSLFIKEKEKKKIFSGKDFLL